MTAQAVSMNPPSLSFAKSESKAVGVRGGMMDTLRDNAPRIVGGLKMVGDIAAAVSLDPFLMGYTAFAVTGRLIMIAYGTKENQEKAAQEAAASGEKQESIGALQKVMRPRQYPVESSAGLSTVAETFGIGYGISQFAKGGTGYTAVLFGVLAVLSYANMLFGKEGNAAESSKDAKDTQGESSSLTFASSKSEAVGFIGRARQFMKDNPVMVSSLMQACIAASMCIGGIIERPPDTFPWYALSAGIGFSACLIQAFFVRKNEFNVEGVKKEGIPGNDQPTKASKPDKFPTETLETVFMHKELGLAGRVTAGLLQ